MNLSPELIVGLAGLITALFVGVAGWRNTSITARKDEVVLLRDEVSRLHDKQKSDEIRITRLEEDRRMLIDDVGTLRRHSLSLQDLMVKAGIANIPGIPELNSDGWTTPRRRYTDFVQSDGEGG